MLYQKYAQAKPARAKNSGHFDHIMLFLWSDLQLFSAIFEVCVFFWPSFNIIKRLNYLYSWTR